MQEGRLIAISDVHLDTWRDQSPETFEAKKQAFLEFLKWIRDDSGCQHFAVVGDLLDVPQLDHSPILPRFREITMHLWAIMQSGIKVYYIVGNHDAGLMGLDVAMSHPPLELVYPGVDIRCGGIDVWLEHGHLMDAWLWAFLQHRTTRVAEVPPAQAMAHFMRPCQPLPSSTPATAFVHETLYEALQWRAMDTGFTDDEKRLGLTVMSQHLDDEFRDVADNEDLPFKHAEIMALLERLGLTVKDLQGKGELAPEALELFMLVGARYYSTLPWRRAAKCRMREVRDRLGPQVRGLIMGHVHHVDRYAWEADGTTLTYANCGSWGRDGGSFALVDQGEIRAFRRRWDDPLPELD
ncbi:MAG: metallophosphoesterase [Armatimonadia bacterium]